MSVKKADHVQEELKRGNDMSRSKIDNTFMRSMEQIENLEKVFREGGLLEKAVMDIKGDIAWMKDIREALSGAYESIQDGHQGTTGHMDMPEESIEENRYGGRLGFRDMEALGDEAASEIDMQARRMGSADMEPGDADELRYKIAVDMGYIKESIVTEGVLDSDDDDGFMARSQLYFMARDAISLHGMIDDRQDLEPWVQSKIAQSAEAIDAVRRYTEYNSMKASGEAPIDMPVARQPEMESVEEGYAILPPMDTEKYQERDGLEGPIPTKSGKVVYYDPKVGMYYDPDTDMYLTYDDWKALDEAVMECGCDNDSEEFNPLMRYLQLQSEGREQEAQELAEALPALIPLAVNVGARVAPWVIRQVAGRGAANVAKQVMKRGVKRGAQVTKRALRRKGAKGKAGRSAAGNAALYGTDGAGGDMGGANLDYLTKMNASADEGKPAITEADVDFQAIGRKLEDMSMDYKSHKADVDALTKQLGLKDPFETLNYLGRVGEHLEHYGIPGGFGAKSLDELAKKAMLDKDMTLTIVKMGNAKLKKEGDVDGSKYQDAKPDNSEPNDYVEGANFVKNLRAQLEGKYKSDAQRKAVHAAKNESGIMYKAGVKKYGEKGMKAIQSAAGSGASAEEIGAIKDRYNKKRG